MNKENQQTHFTQNENSSNLELDVSIWLDNYDDIFSDFDYRPFSGRAFSDDFLNEVRKVCKESDNIVDELKLFIPSDKRNEQDEQVIIERLNTFFQNNRNQFEKLYKNTWRKGIIFALIGILFMLGASYISSLKSDDFLINSLFVIFEPAGWFWAWSGLDIVFFVSKQSKKEIEFYNKLSKSKIVFFSI